MGGNDQSNNGVKDDKQTKMFEPCNVGKEPTDACALVSEDILIMVTKCHDGRRIVELIQEEKCGITEGEPKSPGTLVVTPHGLKPDSTGCMEGSRSKELLNETDE